MLDASTLRRCWQKTSDARLAETCRDLGDRGESYSQRRACALVDLHPRTSRVRASATEDTGLSATPASSKRKAKGR
jgi:hypothetical protein